MTKLKKNSSPEPLSQFQPILAQSILGLGDSSFFKWKKKPINYYKVNKFFCYSCSTFWYIDLNCFLRWAMWPMGLLFGFDETLNQVVIAHLPIVRKPVVMGPRKWRHKRMFRAIEGLRHWRTLTAQWKWVSAIGWWCFHNDWKIIGGRTLQKNKRKTLWYSKMYIN